MEKELNARERYKYDYSDYWVATCFSKFCFYTCCKNCGCYQRAEKKFELFDKNK
jgi:hypothetical protein